MIPSDIKITTSLVHTVLFLYSLEHHSEETELRDSSVLCALRPFYQHSRDLGPIKQGLLEYEYVIQPV